ncbi:nucleotidyltransferase family protein [Candidatus Woesearchaeota archaeon]|nr:nucleotidyltransferase family protein [Candidatus Woesearchaeota archaeon]
MSSQKIPKTAVFLLGGKGTRFRPVTYEIPKALLPVQGKTVTEHLFELFKKYDITNYIFSVGHMADKIQNYFGDGKKWGVTITYIEEKEPAGSAGAIKLARKYLREPFIVTNGDELKDIKLDEMYEHHKKTDAKITVALTSVQDPTQYGVAKLENNKILDFIEKPTLEQAPSNLINSGLSIWQSEVVDVIPEGFAMYEKHVFPQLAKKGQLYAYKFKGQWFDTGTPERYEKAIKQWRGLSGD